MFKKNYVDIILPTYNSKKFIVKTVNSIINQSYRDWRIIIIDDASTDQTLTILNKFYLNLIKKKKIIIIKNYINRGQSYCRNIGIKYSNAKFIAFIDSDDFWFKKKLEQQIKFMIYNDYAFTYTDYMIIKKNKKKSIHTPSYFNFFKFIRNTSIATSTMIICKYAIRSLFHNKIRLCEDYLFKCKLLKKYNAYKCPGVFTKYRIRNNSLQSSRIQVLLAVWKINRYFNNMNNIKNLFSIICISLNSFLKYGIR